MTKGLDYELFLESIFGVVAIDMEGKVTYISQQTCDYCHLNHDSAIGKHINELIPFSKMTDTIRYKQPPTTDFYFADDGRVSASTRVPLVRDGKMVGVLEYDIFQDMGLVESFVDHYINLDEELKYYRDEVKNLLGAKYTVDNLIGYSTAMGELKEQILYMGRSNSTVLIHGETGTGKELVAHAIHNLSKRKFNNFIKMNAAGLPESLAESELFGYAPGTFTGAAREGKKGKFELANHGTLFIDEIEQMPITLQPKLLRVLQEKEVERIGSSQSIPLDIRIITATNKDLKTLVKEGSLREDLYYRLNVVEIKIPPLRERREDIPALAQHFINHYNNLLGKYVNTIEDGALRKLTGYDWPGNVRELQNVIERCMNYIEGNVLTADHLNYQGDESYLSVRQMQSFDKPIDEAIRRAERAFILQALKSCEGNKTKTAQMLKITRPLLYKKLKRLAIE